MAKAVSGSVLSRREIVTSGRSRFQRASTGASNAAVRLCAHTTRMVPPTPCPTARASRMASSAASTARRASGTAARQVCVWVVFLATALFEGG